ARASGRPVFFLGFDASARAFVEDATRGGAQLYNLLRAIPFNPRFTLKKTTFFANLDVWDVVMAKPFDEKMALLTNPEKRTEMREMALQRQRRRPGVPGRFIKWQSIIVSKVALEKNRALVGRTLTELAESHGKHVADMILDLAVEERLETEFLLQSRSREEDGELAEYVKTGHALPSQTDAGAHLNTNVCTAGAPRGWWPAASTPGRVPGAPFVLRRAEGGGGDALPAEPRAVRHRVPLAARGAVHGERLVHDDGREAVRGRRPRRTVLDHEEGRR